MVTFRKDGGVQMDDGRVIYADSPITLQDFICLNKIPWFNRAFSFPGLTGGGGGSGPGGGGSGGGGGGGGSGAQGSQGAQGAQGPGVGAQGAQGADGAQGSTGSQGAQGPGGTPTNDIFAATRVVDPAGAGTDLTIASAIAFIAGSPDPGGDIYIKPGTYVEAAPLALPASKSCIIRGAGKDATIIQYTGVGTLFQSPVASPTGPYVLRDFTATGNGLNATFLSIAGSDDFIVDNVAVVDFRTIVSAGANAPEILFRDCALEFPAVANTSWYLGSAGGVLTWVNTEGDMPTVSAQAITGAPDWIATNSYIGGPPAQSGYLLGRAVWHDLKLDMADVRLGSPDCRIANSTFEDVVIRVLNTKTSITGSTFLSTALNLEHIRIIGVGGISDCEISSCDFDGGGLSARSVHWETVVGALMSNCTFRGHLNEAILIDHSVGIITGCRFVEPPGIQPVEENGTDCQVRYTNNLGFGGSVILGTKSLVENENYRNVKTWGATGDGVTDDSAAIQAAVDALPLEGGIVFFPPGRYLATVEIVIPDKNVTFQGSGTGFTASQGTTLDIGAAAINVFHMTGADHVAIRDMLVRGDSVIGSSFFIADAPTTNQFVDISDVTVDGLETGFINSGADQLLVRAYSFYWQSFMASSIFWSGLGQIEGINSQATGGTATGPVSFAGNNFNLILDTVTTPNEVFVLNLSNSFLAGEFHINLDGGVLMAACNFGQVFTVPDRYLDFATDSEPSTVMGCTFQFQAAVEEIRTADMFLVVEGSTGDILPRITEVGIADNNRFEPLHPTSTIIGPSTVINGAKRADSTDTTEDGYVSVFIHQNSKGLVGIGTIVNTDGANSLTVRETVIDVFGNTVSKETVVVAGPGGDYLLDLQTNFVVGGTTAFPPFISYQVEVKSTTPGSPATYELHHMSQGAM